ncbi:MAG: DUF1579 family protein [Verrucomicrobia bacterium]|nr:DUF1579 family protein [Verrucomicrobiota bacterium]
MEMPKPTEAHRRLHALAGHWIGQETIPPCPWDPKGGTDVGHCDNRVCVDGFLLTHDYEQERDGRINFRGHGVFTFDPAQKCYVLHWWDSMGVAANIFKGDFNGQRLQMLCHDAQGHSRTTWEFPDADHYRFLMEMSQDGQQWMTLMEGNYTKKS